MNNFSDRKWKILSITLIGIIGAVGVAGFVSEQFTPKAQAARPTPTIQVRESIGAAGIMEPGQSAASLATCNSDERITGGGYTLPFPGTAVVVSNHFYSDSVTPAAWRVFAHNPTTNSASVFAYAECTKIVAP